eukprot:m.214611 g.214611  ORF g.214611 m.214611 type:complete len:60 (+) comp15870_c0_seq1:106-285(+)
MMYDMHDQFTGPTATDAKKVSGGIEIIFQPESLGQGLEFRPNVCPFFKLNQFVFFNFFQ